LYCGGRFRIHSLDLLQKIRSRVNHGNLNQLLTGEIT
jgi:hypothetical protein